MQRMNLWIAILFCFYLLTFSGRFHAIDEMSTFVMTESLVKHGRLTVEQMRWSAIWTPPPNWEGQDGYYYSKTGVGIALLAVPFYALGLLLPDVSVVHTVMLMSIVITIGSAVLLAAIVRRLGYDRAVSLTVATIFAVATPAWHYSRTIFDTPVTTFCWLLGFWAFLALERSRWWAIVAGMALGASALMKPSNILGVAVFVGWDLWRYLKDSSWANSRRDCFITFGRYLSSRLYLFGTLFLIGMVLLGLNWSRFGNPLETGYRPTSGDKFTFDYMTSLPALVLSPGKSIFVFAPSLLVALLDWQLFWQRQCKVAWLVLALSVTNLLLYGGWSMWWGPWSWGPRFLIALVPFLLLPLAEVLRHKGYLTKIAVVSSVIAGVMINAMGVVVDPTDYLAILLRRDIVELATIWSPALWPPLGAWIALVEHSVRIDIAWAIPELIWVSLSLFLLTLIGLGLFWLNTRAQIQGGDALSGSIILVALTVVLMALPYVATSNEDANLRLVSQTISNNLGKDDVVCLDVPPWGPDKYLPFVSQWMNHYKALPPYTAVIRGDASERLLYRLAQHRRIWLILPHTPPAPSEAASSTEHWWAEHAAFLDDQWVGQVRVVQFIPVPAADDTPMRPVAVLDDAIELLSPTITRIDKWVIVTLPWRVLQPPNRDLRIFVQLLGQDGRPIALHDRIPQSGFAPTTSWQPNQIIVDRYALGLPVHSGSFELIVGFYDPGTGMRLPVSGGRDFVYLGSAEK